VLKDLDCQLSAITAFFVLLLALNDAKDLAVFPQVHTDRYQQQDAVPPQLRLSIVPSRQSGDLLFVVPGLDLGLFRFETVPG
jgi:hypothetical protein